MNLWFNIAIGLYDGATGTVVDIISQNNHQPPDLRTIAVIVEFENYTVEVLFLMRINHCVFQYVQLL